MFQILKRQNKFGNPSLFGTLQYASGSSVLVNRCRHRLHTPTQETIDTVIAGTVFAVAVNFILFGTTKILSVLGIYHDFLIGAPLRLIGFAILPEQKPKETCPAKVCKRMLSWCTGDTCMSGLNLEVGDDRSQHVLRKHECSCCTSCTVQKFSFQHPSTPNQHFKCCFWRVKLKDHCFKFEVVPTHACMPPSQCATSGDAIYSDQLAGHAADDRRGAGGTSFQPSRVTFALQRWVAWSDDNAFEWLLCLFHIPPSISILAQESEPPPPPAAPLAVFGCSAPFGPKFHNTFRCNVM